MKAFQCSKCEQLDINDSDDMCFCKHGINAMPNYRDKSDKEECIKCFIPLPKDKHWHGKFSWE